VNPQQPMVGCRGRQNRVRLSGPAVGLLEMREKARHCARTDWNVPSYADVAVTQFAWRHAEALVRVGIVDPQQFVRQQFAKAPVNLADAVGGDRLATEIPRVDPLLDCDMRFGFQLQIALSGVCAVVILKCAFDVDRQFMERTRSANAVDTPDGKLRRKPADFAARSTARSVRSPLWRASLPISSGSIRVTGSWRSSTGEMSAFLSSEGLLITSFITYS
jgi:hypothetical protein